MRDIYIDAANMRRCKIDIGRVGENNACRLDFDLLHFLQQPQNASIKMTLWKPIQGEIEKTLTVTNGHAYYVVTSDDIGENAGYGAIQIAATQGNETVKSAIAQTNILPSLTERPLKVGKLDYMVLG